MTDRELMQQALECTPHKQLIDELLDSRIPKTEREHAAAREIEKLRERLAQPARQQEKYMPITDENGKALRPQYRVIEQIGNWYLLYDQHQSGEAVRHEFRIQKLRHDIALYPGITLTEAQTRFNEKVEADHE